MLPGLGDEANEPVNVVPLRRLLGAAAAVLLVGAAGFLLWDLATGAAESAAGLFLLVLVSAGATVVLFVRRDLSVPELRRVESLVFGALAAYLAWVAYAGLGEALVNGDSQALGSRWDATLLHFVLLMVAYGAAVPNPWHRAARVIGSMALTPVSVIALLWVSRPDVAATLQPFVTPGRVADSTLALLIGAAVAVMAAYLIDQYLGLTRTTRISIRYLLRRRIGQGGMGEVWLAEHNLLARLAAIKLIRSDRVDRENPVAADLALRRFEREAQATARLRSVHTVEIYDFGVTGEGTFYYAMEYLDGIDLRSLVERHGPVPPARVVHILEQACRSLAEAHRHRMTHRDIKPANIFICRLGEDCDFVKVLDFGLVKTGEGGLSAPEESTELTLEGGVNGTPGYMAPELVYGASEPDGRADIYALGCVGYYLLTGVPVFEGPPLSVLVDHARTAPIPPSKRTDMEIPAELEQVILKCLEKDPADRYRTASELAEALVACCPEPPWERSRAADWWQLHLPDATSNTA